jgi:hypothetical protein
MFGVGPATKVYLAVGSTDLRKGLPGFQDKGLPFVTQSMSIKEILEELPKIGCLHR